MAQEERQMAETWTDWPGHDWDGDPDLPVHVRFADGVTDEHLPPSPARNLGLAGEPSNWRRSPRDMNSVVAYRAARRDSTPDEHLVAVEGR